MYVTHDQSDALAIGDRIAVLNAGRLVQIGTPREIYDAPATCSSPISSGPCRSARSRPAGGLRRDGRVPGRLPHAADLAAAAHRARPAMSAARSRWGCGAEDVRDAGREPDPDHVCLSGPVRAIDRNGRDAYLTVQVGESRLVARFSGRTEARVGDVVTVAVDAARAHVFDSGHRRCALHHPRQLTLISPTTSTISDRIHSPKQEVNRPRLARRTTPMISSFVGHERDVSAPRRQPPAGSKITVSIDHSDPDIRITDQAPELIRAAGQRIPPANGRPPAHRPQFSRAVSPTLKDDHMSAPVPATRAGNCECCSTAYRAGTPIVWDSVVAGWVLAAHRSAGSRR